MTLITKQILTIITRMLSSGNISVISCWSKFSPYAIEGIRPKITKTEPTVTTAANKILSNFSGCADDYMTGIIIPIPSKAKIEYPTIELAPSGLNALLPGPNPSFDIFVMTKPITTTIVIKIIVTPSKNVNENFFIFLTNARGVSTTIRKIP